MTHKHFIAAILAAAVSITALAPAQARAGNNTAEIVAGVAALAIIGAAISESSNNRNVYVTRNVHPRPRHGWQPRRHVVRQHRQMHRRHYQRHHQQHQPRHHGHGGHR